LSGVRRVAQYIVPARGRESDSPFVGQNMGELARSRRVHGEAGAADVRLFVAVINDYNPHDVSLNFLL
jgi:hypothetical protein